MGEIPMFFSTTTASVKTPYKTSEKGVKKDLKSPGENMQKTMKKNSKAYNTK